MEQLKVIGIEEGVLVVATEAGERFAVPVDDTLRTQLRRLQRSEEPRTVRPSPREVQAHIRSGMSAAEVAELLGARLEDIQRYEGPVLAEREHVVSQALAVPVLIGGELDPGAQPTFGTAVRAKLADAGASGERWTSWREETGWMIKLEFTANEVDHDARWSFDPRRSTLSPQNSDATQLSRQGSLPEGLIPRLRALDSTSPVKDSSRFDSGAFGPRRIDPAAEIVSHEARGSVPAAQEAAIKRAPERGVTSADTADLLEALRRRRGVREPMPDEPTTDAPHSSPALLDALEPGYEPAEAAPVAPADDAAREDAGAPDAARRKGRTSMPSWDEIVFGARTEDG
ncbi:septation protein SepH [Microbacterium dextranolyticum]|uniref:DNA-binding protein n=1 Tax=Microbacterium dextranolyticum TaxID=36806 RepID=A0A9W6HN57_9MICO|nr:septation protein SepH [Microbacterium dextranolyticum]GLJ95907.1 DNA-binding protein [Microbacterium dextranolyticum]